MKLAMHRGRAESQRSRRGRSIWGALLTLSLVLAAASAGADGLDVAVLVQAPVNPVPIGTQSVTYRIRTENFDAGGEPTTIGVGIDIRVDGSTVPADSDEFTTSGCGVDPTPGLGDFWACNNLVEGGSQTISFTWNAPAPGASTIEFRGFCQIIPVPQSGFQPCTTANSDAVTTIVETISFCGDGELDSGEECDDGNTTSGDGCSSICVREFCGDGVTQLQLDEECDDGNGNDLDSCRNDCTLPFCGDGFLDADEECDDGNNTAGDGCSAFCAIEPFCGDGNLDPNEECDDGNNANGDGCSSICGIEPFCGDGTQDPGEECDDNNNLNGDGCSALCEIEPFCGDGNQDPGEECDDGNNLNNDGCSAVCDIEPFCGDGNQDPGEGCDDGNSANGDGCSEDCTIEAFCGDENLDPGEECDDGNNAGGDGCSAVCSIEPFCGDGDLDDGEECDDGNTTAGDGCSAVCAIEPFCGDGDQDPGEECDDDNNLNGDGCSAECTVEPFCGDGDLDDGEDCDDGNTANGDGCSADCNVEPFCGDGTLDAGEACDDGNTIPGDGCSAACAIEAFCGDGTLDAGEACDDGNNIGGDGCSSACVIEAACGDGTVDLGEGCDDGNNVDGDGCSAACVVEAACGDGTLDAGEACDDGNNIGGDGCSPACAIEFFCGDGNLDAEEACDDGNNLDGDGCSALCQVEAFCGDGTIDAPNEECDDGNNNNGDGCSAVCTSEELVEFDDWAEDLELVGDHILVAAQSAGLQIVEFSEGRFGAVRAFDPARCDGRGSPDFYVEDVEVSESGLAYMALGPCGIGIVSVEELIDPEADPQMTLVPIEGWVEDVSVVGDTAYVAAFEGGLVLLDVTSPGSVGVVGTTGFASPGGFGAAIDVEVMGDAAYVATTRGLRVVDVSDRENPEVVGRFATDPKSGPAQDVEVADFEGRTVAFLSTWEDGLELIDVTDPSAPFALRDPEASEDSSLEVTVAGSTAFLADGRRGLRVFSVLGEEPFLQEGVRFPMPGVAWDVEVRDAVAIVAFGSNPSGNQSGGLLSVQVGALALSATDVTQSPILPAVGPATCDRFCAAVDGELAWKIKKVGVEGLHDWELKLTLDDDGRWLGEDADGNLFSGTYEKKRQNKRRQFVLRFNADSKSRLLGVLEGLAEPQTGADVRLRYRGNPKLKLSRHKSNVKLKGVVNVDVIDPEGNSSVGEFEVRRATGSLR